MPSNAASSSCRASPWPRTSPATRCRCSATSGRTSARTCPRRGAARADELDPLKLPTAPADRPARRSTATTRRPSSSGRRSGIRVPPCFIVVCQNTSISKLVYDFISGFQRKNEDGTTTLENGRLALFRNFDETRQPAAAPEHAAHRQRAARSRRCARRQLPRHGGRRDRALPPRDRRAHRRRARRREHHRPGTAARGHEHGRQSRSARRSHPLRRLGLDAHRRLGRQHRHARPRHPRLRHAAPVRAGHRPRAAPPVVRPERRRACSTSSTPTSSAFPSTSRPSRSSRRRSRRARRSRSRPCARSAMRSRSASRASRATASSCRRSG